MDKENQTRIVNEMCDGLKSHLLERMDKVPEEWDGFELRQWIVDYAQANISYAKMQRARMKDYRNTLLVNNLL